VDDRPGPRIQMMEITRFPIGSVAGSVVGTAASGWLYSSQQGSPLPVIGNPNDLPNIAILFKEPMTLAHARRKMVLNRGRARGPKRNTVELGVLLRAADPRFAQGVFSAHGIPVRQHVGQDVAGAPQGSPSTEGGSRKALVGLILLVVLRAGLFFIPDAEAEDCGDITSYLRRPAPQDSTKVDRLESVLLRNAPDSYELSRDEPLDMWGIISRRPATSRDEIQGALIKYDMSRAWGREWVTADQAKPDWLTLEVVEFHTPDAAWGYQRWQANFNCDRVDNKVFLPEVDGEIGFFIDFHDKWRTYNFSWVRGSRRYHVVVGALDRRPDLGKTTDFVQAAVLKSR
jgi:hypothetical protein